VIAGVDASLGVPVVIFATVSREGCDRRDGRVHAHTHVSIRAGVPDAVVEFAGPSPA